MTQEKMMQVLMQLRPGAQFSVSGPALSDVTWHDETVPPTQAELDATLAAVEADAAKEALVTAVQQHLDAKARERGYDNIFTAVTYAEEAEVPGFQAEGQAFRKWRSQVWATCYQVLAQVQGGQRAVPTREELLAELPAAVLPA